jgi:ferredoxin--NADP+ reductase
MPYTILAKRTLAPKTVLFEIEAPQVARKAKAGQFIILRVQDQGERIPLTIAQANPERGTVTIVIQELGKTTFDLNRLEVGESVLDFVGPLGKPTHIENKGTVVCVGGGVGNAVVWAQVRGFKEAGNRVITIIGARTKELLILEDEIGALSDQLIVTTDDGSYGRKGLVTEPLAELLEKEHVDEVVTIGPVIMMKFVCKTTAAFGVPTQASLNPIMVDGTGMCGACRVTVGGQTRFACVDGPEFDGHQVDFDELMTRLAFYKDLETAAYERARDHDCNLLKQG